MSLQVSCWLTSCIAEHGQAGSVEQLCLVADKLDLQARCIPWSEQFLNHLRTLQELSHGQSAYFEQNPAVCEFIASLSALLTCQLRSIHKSSVCLRMSSRLYILFYIRCCAFRLVRRSAMLQIKNAMF